MSHQLSASPECRAPIPHPSPEYEGRERDKGSGTKRLVSCFARVPPSPTLPPSTREGSGTKAAGQRDWSRFARVPPSPYPSPEYEGRERDKGSGTKRLVSSADSLQSLLVPSSPILPISHSPFPHSSHSPLLPTMILVIDNYDSFTYNLVQYLGELGCELHVVRRNDAITVGGRSTRFEPSHIVLSPGPCTPNEAGIFDRADRRLAGRIPILGVCLGHQAIGQVFGAQVVRSATVMHGKVSPVYHDGTGVHAGLSDPFIAT